MATAKKNRVDTDQDAAQPIRRRYGEEENVAPRGERRELDQDPAVEEGRGARLVNPHDEFEERFKNS